MLLSVEETLDFAAMQVDERVSSLVRNGVNLTGSDIQNIDRRFMAGENVLIKDQNGAILAIGTADIDSTRLSPTTQEKVFNYERVIA
jgi:archaeosine-15-forming tRNA-guanine transglycosylase